MTKYIDADALLSKYGEKHFNGEITSEEYYAIKIPLDYAPTADVVEVVRCKDCINWQKDWSVDLYGSHYCPNIDTRTMEDDYCSFGERREDERNK